MAHIEINIPETLQYQLESISQNEGISLNQYIVYALTRQVVLTPLIQNVSKEDRVHQHRNFMERIERLGKTTSADDLEKIMEERETVAPEPDLNPTVISRLKYCITEAKNKSRA